MKLNLRSRRTTSTTVSLHQHEAPSLESSSNQKVCLVCSEKQADYCCPRCFKPYCSVSCYKSHDILCTEEFNRDQVEALLSREKEQEGTREGVTVVEGDIGGGDGGTTATREAPEEYGIKRTHDRDIDYESTEDEVVEEEGLGDEERALVEQLAAKLAVGCESELLTREDRRLLARVSHSASARKLMTQTSRLKPYWDSSLNIEKRHHMRVQISQVIDYIVAEQERQTGAYTKKVGNVSVTGSGGDVLHFQLLGLLMGYVVVLRTLNGNWTNHADDNEEGSEDMLDEAELRASCLEALGLFVQSTPFLEPSFRPMSVDATVQGWALHRPPSLRAATVTVGGVGGHNRGGVSSLSQATRAVLRDVRQILSSLELTVFALLDCWLLGCVCNTTVDLSIHTFLRLACRPPPCSVPYAEDVTAILAVYQPLFATAAPSVKRSFNKKTGRREDTHQSNVADKFSRKCYFLVDRLVQQVNHEEREDSEGTGRGVPRVGVRRCDWANVLLQQLEIYDQEVFLDSDKM
mmetsp:Transcript_29610/g.54782  ORF Transcript_29610/g.54782 Transcript_29610/m.54782 type:complete len:520 (-) Transcript_29610:75-1634(-)